MNAPDPGSDAVLADGAFPIPLPIPLPATLDYVLVGGLTGLTVLVTAFVIFFLPSYIGSVPVPVSLLLGAGWVFWAVRASHDLVPSMWAAAAPALAWVVASAGLGLTTSFGYGLVIGDWRAQLMVSLGALAAAGACGLCWVRELTHPRRER